MPPRKRAYIGLAATLHDPALAIVAEDGRPLFAEATERALQYKRAFNCPPDDHVRAPRLVHQYCGDDAEIIGAVSWSSRWLAGLTAGLETDVARVEAMCKTAGARTVRIARDEAERARLWQGRKKAFGAMGRISPHLVVQDAVIPRTRLPDVLATIHEIAHRQRITVCNVFHAGDGNLHPNIGYDANDPDEQARVHAAMREIMAACVAAGGTITGEHGIGLDKLDYMDLIFSSESLAAMCRLREVFDPDRRANPGKVVPVHSCREWHGVRKAAWNA